MRIRFAAAVAVVALSVLAAGAVVGALRAWDGQGTTTIRKPVRVLARGAAQPFALAVHGALSSGDAATATEKSEELLAAVQRFAKTR